ncbi:uncharacterized protein TM35_000192040 [Trypanosoma theileri]|uniref:UDP-galactose transporter n=1 Tax=Trypanosoma theileri TaxID=67003 RepID=A0A1X0NV21_9TRYP|nr:uncharacterized protein TM35_000192040 [Trypanosoma theileri]ORC87960.1 hypothetical protein TM35_000192040 [Trypanosoma theileri]
MAGRSTAPHQTQELRKSQQKVRESKQQQQQLNQSKQPQQQQQQQQQQQSPQKQQEQQRQNGKVIAKPSSSLSSSSSSSSSFIAVMLQMAVCVVGIYVCFGLWSIKQERVVTKPYYPAEVNGKMGEGSKLSTVFVLGFAQASAAVCVGLLLLLSQSLHARFSSTAKVNKQTDKEIIITTAKTNTKTVSITPTTTKKKLTSSSKSKEDTHHHHHHDKKTIFSKHRHTLLLTILMGFTNAFGSTLGYAAMRRLPYPVVLATKMSKMVPVMLVGFFWYGTRYSLGKCMAAALITGGVLCFYLLEEVHHPHQKSKPNSSNSNSNNNSSTTGPTAWIGFFLLFLNLLTDGFTNSTQDVLVKTQRWTGNQLMVFTNLSSGLWLALVLIALEILHPLTTLWLETETTPNMQTTLFSPLLMYVDSIIRWLLREVAPLQDFSHTWRFFQRHPDAMYDVAVMSCMNAVGQIFVFRTITLFGTLTLTALTLLRKSGSVVLSILVHGHHVAFGQWLALIAVFAGAVWEGLMHARKTPAKKKTA